MKISTLFNPTYGIVRAVVALLLGVALVVWPGTAVALFVKILGAVMVLVGGIAIAINLSGKENLGSLFMLTGVIAVVFGILLLIFPDFFVKLISYLFGALMIFFSLGEIVTLISTGKHIKIRLAFYIVPILLFLGGIVMLMNPIEVVETIFIVFGIAAILYAVYELVFTISVKKALKLLEAERAREQAKEEALVIEPSDSKVVVEEEAVEVPSDGDSEEEDTDND